APGKTYLTRMTEQNGAAGNMDPYLRLEDSKGTHLAQDDDGEGNLNARIEFNPPREDTYRVVATTWAGPRTGKYLVTVEAFPPGRVPPPSSFAVTGGGFVPNLTFSQNLAQVR